jgi:hypothetical protein
VVKAKKATGKTATRKKAAKRELIAPRGDKRYIRRDAKGRIKGSDDERATMKAALEALPFREFEFHGFTGKRRTVSYGWRYDFNGGRP